MSGSTATRFLATILFCLAPLAVCIAQDTSPSLEERIGEALRTGDGEVIVRLVKANRLEIKPLVNGLIDRAIRMQLGRKEEAAADNRRFARTLATAFETAFGETSLSTAAGYLDRWSPADLAEKLIADSLYASGTDLRGSSDTRDQATADYEKALELYRKIGDRIGEATTVGGLGYIAWFADRDNYLALNEEALSLRREVDDRELIGNSLNDVALAYRIVQGDNETALIYYLESERLRIEIGDSLALSRQLANIGRTYSISGELETALTYYERAAVVTEAVGDGRRQAEALRNAGAVASDLGRFPEALSHFERALEVRKANGEETVDILNHLGITHRRLGDFESALRYYQEVVALATESGNGEEVASALSNIGVVYVYAERPDRSIRYFERSRDQFRGLEDSDRRLTGMLNAEINLGSAQFDLGDYAAAQVHTTEALRLAEELDDLIGQATANILSGNVLNRLGEYEASVVSYQRGLRSAVALGMPELIYSSTLGLGEVNERRGDYDAAITYYEDAFDVLESTRGRLDTDEDKAGFLAQQRYAYEDYIHMLTKLDGLQPDSGHNERSFLFAERAKARAFLDLLAEALANVQSGVDPLLLERQDSLLQSMAILRNDVLLESSATTRNAGTLDSLKGRLAAAEAEYGVLQRQIREENPRFSELQYPQPLTLGEVRETVVDDDVALLEYSLGDSSSTLWVVTRESDRLIRLASRDEIREQVELVRFALTDPRAAGVDLFSRSARRLYEMLLAPASELIDSYPNLVIVPDDALYYLPFEVLLSADVADGSSFSDLPYLIASHAVSYAPSASILGQLTAGRDARINLPSKGLLAFGDPVYASEVDGGTVRGAVGANLARLPFSGKEVQAISAYFEPGDADVFLRAAATEDRLKSAESMGRYRYLHLATHGLVDEKRPDFSAVVLAYDENSGQDGLLQAAEIFNLKLNADLVVLSACETGLGRMVRGEGLVGLTRAFMYAGAPSVVVSLWAVADESTSTLMDRFYGHLVSDSTDKSNALRQAKAEMIAGSDYSHPFYWAPFVLSGDWR